MVKIIFNLNINTSLKVEHLEDLPKLKIFLEVNELNKPNFSKLARELGVDRRTVKKHYEGFQPKKIRNKKSKIDDYYKIISKLLSNKSPCEFTYKNHLYRFLKREYGVNFSRSNFNYYILKHEEFANYFKPKGNNKAIKTETAFGKQAQFDWKEKVNFEFKNGEKIIINIASLVLSASRFKIWRIYLSVDQSSILDFLTRTFELIGGVPREILIDNATTMMTDARTLKNKGKVHNKFQQFSKDFGFKVKPCIAGRPQTKGKVENPMRIIEEIKNYNGILESYEELYEKMKIINDEANMRVCQAINLPPIFVFKKEKEHLQSLPNERICSYYKTKTKKFSVNLNSLFKYQHIFYSVPSEYIGKKVSVHVTEKNLYVYYNKNLITVHKISDKKVNYRPNHHLDMVNNTFTKKEKIEDYTLMHFRELEKFNEQVSAVIRESQKTEIEPI